jgi:hypothetical protein
MGPKWANLAGSSCVFAIVPPDHHATSGPLLVGRDSCVITRDWRRLPVSARYAPILLF